MNARESYEQWLTSPVFDQATKDELRSIAGDETAIAERFTGDLEFGTAGLRGIVAAGTNRMNVYTVRKASQGIANYIVKKGLQQKGVAISFDCRHMSTEFAQEAALVFCANGIPVYIFPYLHATPILSFAVRYLKCVAGVNVTASHNPPEYNGYKVYWEDGAQISPPVDAEIIAEVNAVTDYGAPKTMSLDDAKIAGLYRVIGSELDDAFLANVKAQIKHPEAIAREAADIRIVYTPLCGCGNIPVRRVLKELGFTQVYVVPEQEKPNGDFPTLAFPNPEEPSAYELALKLAAEVDADLVLATDPDADRLGCYLREGKGKYFRMTGNMTGCLLADYEIGCAKELGGGVLPAGATFISTIVTSNLAGAVARKHGVDFYETLTGFKYICGKANELEASGKPFRFLFGFEESYGCTIGDYCRDKDSVVACAALCEMVAYYKMKGMSLKDALEQLYREVGYYRDINISQYFRGLEGKSKMAAMMDGLRNDPPKTLGGLPVVAMRDYQLKTTKNFVTGAEGVTNLPQSNVLYFELTDDAWVCLRPSGTEPKIKLYCGVCGTTPEEADRKEQKMITELKALMEELSK